MKYLIAGLGNIGTEYNQTRHNIGFDVVDNLAAELKAEFTLQKLAIISEIRLKNKQLVMIKPTTFMNLSGKAIRYYLELHKIPIENLLVITDDLALDVGVIRIRLKGSHGGHNGLRNIEETMQTQQYARMRFGIGNQFHKAHQIDFVLGKWKPEEQTIINQKIIIASKAIQAFVLEGASKTMTQYNG